MDSLVIHRRTALRSATLLLAFILVSVLALPGAMNRVTAQDASPQGGSSLLAELGLPVLDITVTGDGIEMAGDIGAGPVLLTATNQTEALALVDVVQLPAEASVDDFLAVEDAIPEWAARVVFAGGVELEPSATASIVIALEAGEYTVIADAEAEGAAEAVIAEPSTTLVVSGESDGSADAIPAAATIDLGAYVFDIPETITSGPQIWKVTNSHDVLHHALIVRTDRLYTAEEVADGLMAMFSGTPVADGFSFGPETYPVFNSPILSGRQSVWMEVGLEPGTYVAICFVPDPGGDTPHAFAGMIESFEVTEG